MKAITKAARVNAVCQVIQHMNDSMTVVVACRWLNFSRFNSKTQLHEACI